LIAKLAQRLPFYYGWIVVGVVFVTMAVGVNARTAFSLFLPPVLDEFGWDRGVTAGAFSFGFLISAVLSPTLGRLMDRSGPRVVMLLGVAATAAGLLLATRVSEPWHLYLTLGVLVGAGSVCLGYSGQALFLPSWFERRRGFAIGIAYAGVGVGSIVLLPWLQEMIATSGWRSAGWTLGLVVLIVVAPLNLLLRRRPQDLGLVPDGDAAPTPNAPAARRSNVVDPQWAAVDWTLARAMRTGRFWWIVVGYFCCLYAWYAVQVHQTRYLIDIGYSAADAALALGVISLAGIPGQIGFGHLSDRVGREPVWAIGCVGFAVTYLVLLWLPSSPNMVLLYLMVLAQGFLGYSVTSVLGAIPTEIFEGRHYGSIFGTLMLGGIAGGAVGPWVTGLLHDWRGDYVAAWWLAVLVSVLSAYAIYRAAPRKVRVVAGRMAAVADAGPAAPRR
jgi:MFS family permease